MSQNENYSHVPVQDERPREKGVFVGLVRRCTICRSIFKPGKYLCSECGHRQYYTEPEQQ